MRKLGKSDTKSGPTFKGDIKNMVDSCLKEGLAAGSKSTVVLVKCFYLQQDYFSYLNFQTQ